MEDIGRCILALKKSNEIVKKLEDTVEEDKLNIKKGMSGDAEVIYKNQCDKAIDKMKQIRQKIKVLYSESSAGL